MRSARIVLNTEKRSEYDENSKIKFDVSDSCDLFNWRLICLCTLDKWHGASNLRRSFSGTASDPSACMGIYKKEHINLYKEIRHRRLHFGALLCLVGITLLSMPLLSFLNLFSSLFVPNAAAGLAEQMTGGPGWMNILFLAVIPAFSEEFVFRGVFFHGYRSHGFWKAALMSGLIFGLMHLNFNQFSYGFVLGVIFAAVVEASGSIYASMAIHFLINFQSAQAINALTSLTASGVEEEGMLEISGAFQQTYLVTTVIVVGIVAIVTTALVVVLVKLLAKLCDREDYFAWVLNGGEKKALQKRGTSRLIDPFFIGAAAICILFMVSRLLI